ncbi:MAG: hypothetical protein IPM98_17405 [Lewinellaceae bacterium]|nr:hypothetical protein [Lewinellaceae bacterium]
MFIRILSLVAGLWLATASGLSAQVGFALPVLNEVAPGTVVTLPVTVSNFDSIVGVQFVLEWDTAVLKFLTVLNYNLPGMDFESFGLLEASSGILRFAWEAQNVNNGNSVADGTAIFLIKFSVAGQINQGTSIVFTEVPPTAFEVVQVGRPPFGLADCALDNGYVAVGFTLSTGWLYEQNNTLPVTLAPNPFSTYTTAAFDLDAASEIYMVLTDASGHPVLDKKMALSAGRHGIEIASDRLRENGIYYLILRTKTRSCVRPLVKL